MSFELLPAQLRGILPAPEAPRVLYHYCSAATFVAILDGGKVRFSDLHWANDRMEGQWYWHLLLERSNGDQKVLKFVEMQKQEYRELRGGMLGVCLSEEGDLLSQWRGYADDGQGFSVGFETNYLPHSPKWLYPVVYDAKVQNEFADHVIDMIRQEKRDEIGSFDVTDFLSAVLKNPAFAEEREWRVLLHASYDTCDFSAKSGRIVAHVDMPLPHQSYSVPSNPSFEHLISRVIIGPKNSTPAKVVEQMLPRYGHPAKSTRVSTSSATYR